MAKMDRRLRKSLELWLLFKEAELFLRLEDAEVEAAAGHQQLGRADGVAVDSVASRLGRRPKVMCI